MRTNNKSHTQATLHLHSLKPALFQVQIYGERQHDSILNASILELPGREMARIAS